MNYINQAKEQLEKLKEAEDKTIQAIQQNIDESAKEMAAQQMEHEKQKQELEEKHQKENAELEAKKLERNANFVKEMASLKEQLKEKINWNEVDRVMGFFSSSIRPEEPVANDNVSSPILDKKLVNNPIANPKENSWNSAERKKSIYISADRLNATKNIKRWKSVSAAKGFTICADSTGPVLFYFEVTIMSSQLYKQRIFVGLSSGKVPDGSFVGGFSNSYALRDSDDHYVLSGKSHDFEWPNDTIKPVWNGPGDVLGCGLVLNPENELFIFFTGNGILMGKQIPIMSTRNPLYPTVSICSSITVEANFGGNPAKPFKYDMEKCPGIVFD